jgi:hypothetical protein
MATAELAFRYPDYVRPALGAELRGVSRADNQDDGGTVRDELLYRIFCGEDDRLQEMVVRFLSESYE